MWVLVQLVHLDRGGDSIKAITVIMVIKAIMFGGDGAHWVVVRNERRYAANIGGCASVNAPGRGTQW